MKKYSNDTIPAIVDLGDNSYEFCFNHTTEVEDDHTSYMSDVVTIEGKPVKGDIISALIADGMTETEAIELTAGL